VQARTPKRLPHSLDISIGNFVWIQACPRVCPEADAAKALIVRELHVRFGEISQDP
jgi:hypothetical protein